MNISSKIGISSIAGPQAALGARDFDNIMLKGMNETTSSVVRVGIVEQFNVGLYSALVSYGEKMYSCFIGAQTITPTLGYSDLTVLREGDEVLFFAPEDDDAMGMILARKPQLYSVDADHPQTVKSDTEMERRSCFSSSVCYRRKSPAYSDPLSDQDDISTLVCADNRPTDMVAGEAGSINQHRCGWIGGLYSMTVLGGGAHIRMSALENRIRVVADSIMQHTLSGNDYDWHAGRYLSQERNVCLYQDERMGLQYRRDNPFDTADYHDDGYFTKNRTPGQTAIHRISEYDGYYGNLYARYFSRPDHVIARDPVTLKRIPRQFGYAATDPGVARESVDPSGQYRFAATGMIGTERIGRIPVPIRTRHPWEKDLDEPKASQLSEFRHSVEHPFYRQLELADRVAYDMKNSYSRVDEDDGFFVPQEQDIVAEKEHPLEDVYDEGHTGSKTVLLRKYDKRRSGIWQGEDGSIVLRDAWGSEIVMIGGNIQLSCAGNVQIMPGRTALTIAGDDIVQTAQRSVDIHAAQNDVRIDARRNIQVMAGIDDDHPGGITIESVGKSGVWSADDADGGEGLSTSGVLIKSTGGNIATDSESIVLRSKKQAVVVSGDEDVDGDIRLSARRIEGYGSDVDFMTDTASLLMSSSSTVLIGRSVVVAGSGSCAILSGEDVLIPLMWYPIDKNVAEDIEEQIQPLVDAMSDEERVSIGYSREYLNDMKFVFRSSDECRTDGSWEIGGGTALTLYEPFWSQVSAKFETLRGVSHEPFNDNYDLWTSDEKAEEGRGCPWPGDIALSTGRYAMLSNGSPVNMDEDGFNRRRDEVDDHTEVVEVPLRNGYLVRK